jgi:glycosyltransferase involved in cell wall biosynthesis/ubiquinone/menaquinone biosynthesis C-methylase UbiE
MKISVLICTRNRARSLEMALRRFYEQQFEGDYSYELIIVDNDSTDETRQVLDRYAAQRPETTRHLFERRRGLTYARNTAVAAASGEVLVFTDDDVLASADWLNEIHCEFKADPDLRILGGKVLLANKQSQRVSLHACEERQYFHSPDGVNFVMGANMAFRRELFDRVGLFDVRLGAGRFFAGADETELVYRGLKAGQRMLYAPNVLVYHDHDRRTLEQAGRLEYGYAKGCAAYLVKHSLAGDSRALRMLYWTLRSLPKRWRRRQGEAAGDFLRRRWQIKGILIGLFAAPFVMWGNGDRSTPRARHPQRTYFDRIRRCLDGYRLDNRRLDAKARWLDVGCGRQLVPRWMKEQAEIETELKSRAGSLIGVDPDFVALGGNQSHAQKINADAVSLPFADGSFDLVTSNMVFEHVDAPLASLKEIRRVLRDGGRLIILTPNWLDIVTIAARIMPNRWHPAVVSRMETRGAADIYPTRFRFNRPATIEKILREAGFETWSVELLEHPDAYAHVPVVARVEAAWHALARRRPALRGVLLIEAEVLRPARDARR